MDLSFNLGLPLHQVAALPAGDFLAYEAYASRRLLPLQRIEFLLARIAMRIDAQRLPGQPLSLHDYLINPLDPDNPTPKPEPPHRTQATDDEADAIADALGFSPRNRRSTPPDATTTP